jgi:hypothetical protein
LFEVQNRANCTSAIFSLVFSKYSRCDVENRLFCVVVHTQRKRKRDALMHYYMDMIPVSNEVNAILEVYLHVIK